MRRSLSETICVLFLFACPIFGQESLRKAPTKTLDAPVVIGPLPGVPMTLISKNAPPGEEVALRATTTRDGQQFPEAVGVDVSATAGKTFTASISTATGIKIATYSSAFDLGYSTGIEIDALGYGGSGATATGILVSAVGDGQGPTSYGARLHADSSTGDIGGATGVLATAISGKGGFLDAIGVDGIATSPVAGSDTIGVRGTGADFGVFSNGPIGSTMESVTLHPHPTDPDRVVRFIGLEGNENGTYCRGKVRLVNGSAVAELPEEFRFVTEPEGLTIQLTAIGNARVWVEEYGLERAVIAGDRDVEVHYVVNGVRRGFADYEPYMRSGAYRPRVRGIPFGADYPAEVRDALVANGTLNADYTPNEATAVALGWRLLDPADVPAQERWWLDPADRRRLSREKTSARR